MSITQLHPDAVPLRPVPDHFPQCDERANGHAAIDLLHAGDEVTFESLEDAVAWLRDAGQLRCDCAELRLASAENALRLARAAWRARTTDENATRVSNLLAARDAIKAAMA